MTIASLPVHCNVHQRTPPIVPPSRVPSNGVCACSAQNSVNLSWSSSLMSDASCVSLLTAIWVAWTNILTRPLQELEHGTIQRPDVPHSSRHGMYHITPYFHREQHREQCEPLILPAWPSPANNSVHDHIIPRLTLVDEVISENNSCALRH